MRHAYYFVVIDRSNILDPSVFCSEVYFNRKQMMDYMNDYIQRNFSDYRLNDSETHDSGITLIRTYTKPGRKIMIFVSEQ